MAVLRHAAALALALALAWSASALAGGRAETADSLAAAVTGTWRSLDDPQSVRALAADGASAERYAGETVAVGTWEIAATCPDVPSGGEALLVVRDAGDPAPFCYAVLLATPERLELLYLPRGNLLRYERVAE
jgi:hypothetical protein